MPHRGSGLYPAIREEASSKLHDPHGVSTDNSRDACDTRCRRHRCWHDSSCGVDDLVVDWTGHGLAVTATCGCIASGAASIMDKARTTRRRCRVGMSKSSPIVPASRRCSRNTTSGRRAVRTGWRAFSRWLALCCIWFMIALDISQITWDTADLRIGAAIGRSGFGKARSARIPALMIAASNTRVSSWVAQKLSAQQPAAVERQPGWSGASGLERPSGIRSNAIARAQHLSRHRRVEPPRVQGFSAEAEETRYWLPPYPSSESARPTPPDSTVDPNATAPDDGVHQADLDR